MKNFAMRDGQESQLLKSMFQTFVLDHSKEKSLQYMYMYNIAPRNEKNDCAWGLLALFLPFCHCRKVVCFMRNRNEIDRANTQHIQVKVTSIS